MREAGSDAGADPFSTHRTSGVNASNVDVPAPPVQCPIPGTMNMRIDEALNRYNQDIGLGIPIPNSPKTADLILKRYRAGTDESFEPHFDSINEVSNRYLVLIWYLNDVESGGETEFRQLDVKVEPRTGRLLMFPPYWMYQHAGLRPVSGDKFIVSTYLLF